MSSRAIEKLYFSIGLIDKVTGPSKGVTKAINDIRRNMKQGFTSMTLGGGAIYGVSRSLLSLTNSARDYDKALNEVASLDVSRKELDTLGKASTRFAMRFGGAAADVVRSAYDIQSAIPGLKEGALAKFTYSGAVLAKAGKADSATVTKYMGTMYNIFADQAEKLGQAQWVEELTGKTAHAVKIFKTTAGGMSAAFSNLGSIGNKSGIDLNQQMAVLGTLQGSMSGEQAGTAFKSMITKMDQAEKKLGISFKGADGNLLPLNEIIMKIEKNVGSLDKNAQIATLTQAFGEQGAMAVVNMLGKTDQLKKSIEDIAGIKDASGAEKMAQTMVDPLERFQGVWNAVMITIGKVILPGVNLMLSMLSTLGSGLVWLMDAFPPLRWAVGAVVAGIVAMALAWGVLKIAMGVGSIFQAVTIKLSIMKAALWKANVISGTMTKTQKLAAIANWVFQKSVAGVSSTLKFLRLNLLWNKAALLASAVWTKVLAVANWFMNSSFIAATAAVWAFTAALLANPVTWVVLGIMALIGAIYLCVKYWDELKAAFGTVVDFMAKHWQWLLAGMLGPVGIAVKLIIDYWDYIVEAVFWCFEKIKGFWTGLWDFGKAIVQGLFSWIIGKIEGILGFLTKIPFIGGKIQAGLDKVKEFAGVDVNQTKIDQPVVSAVTSARTKDVNAGGVRNTSNNRTTNYGGVTINASNPVGPGQLEDMWALQA